MIGEEERRGGGCLAFGNRATGQPAYLTLLDQTVERVGRGSLTRRWEPRPGACPNIRGGTIDRALPAKTKLWLTGWTKTIAGGQFVSLLVEIADEGGRPNR